MGRIYTVYLDELDSTVFCCSECKTHLSCHHSLVSKVISIAFLVYIVKIDAHLLTLTLTHSLTLTQSFQGHYGRAWLFNTVFNIQEGPAEERSMTTGLHTVKDIFCVRCGKVIGWKYEKAFEESQKYKEGKYILERMMLTESSV